MIRRLALTVSVLAFTTFAAGVARADVPPPNSEPCASKTASAACTTDDGESGTCVPTEASHITYDADGGHGSATSTVLVCTPPGASDGGADGGADGGSGGSGGGSSSSGGCSMGGADLGSGAALLAMLIPFVIGRRRKRAAE
ncbi:MAG: hypothetical protein JWP97_4057 [Labilithrix sp.]|nr:hypothetical protein [Labilithrix sp.]